MQRATHAGDPSAHHTATVDTTCDGEVCDGSNFTTVTAAAGDSATAFFSSGTIEEARVDAAIQRRVSGTCAAGSSIREIDAAGAVTCETDDSGTGDITGVTTGTGLTGGCTTGTCDLAVVPADFTEPIQIKSGVGPVTVDTDTSTYETIDSLSITPPVAGTVLAIASGQVRCASLSPSNLSQEMRTGLTTSSTGTPAGSVSLCVFAETGQTTTGSVVAQEKFSVPGATTTTIYWRGAVTEPFTDSVEVGNWRISLIFVPD